MFYSGRLAPPICEGPNEIVDRRKSRAADLSAKLEHFIERYGEAGIVLLAQASRQWHGSIYERSALIEACGRGTALLEAWEIVHAAGPLAAKLLPVLVYQHFHGLVIDRRI